MARVRTVQGFPDVMHTSLKFTTHINFTQIANVQTFRGNSVFDPDFTGFGEQPMFYDQYTAIYERYLVTSSSVEVLGMNTSNSQAAELALYPSTSSVLPSGNPTIIKSYNHAKFRQVQEQRGGGRVKMFSRMSTKKIRGESLLDDSFGALTSASPTRQWFWHLVGAAGDLTTNVISVTLIITVTYRVKFHKRRTVVDS